MFHRSLRAGLAGAVSLVALSAAAQDAPVREVTLFEAGLAELVRETGAAPEVTLRVPLRDVDDVLKSLLVRGTGIDRARLTLDGPEPVADAFAALPFPPEAATDLETLLRTVPGLAVSVRTAGGLAPREGRVLEVGESCSEAEGCVTELTVLHEDGVIRRWALDGSAEIQILDAEIREALVRGLDALRAAASGDSRAIDVALEGDAIADGALAYVISAPAWKTAYRAILGDGVDLQAWAVIENATGEDWSDVRLTLSSGTPRKLHADLFGRDWRAREEMELTEESMEAPVVSAEAFDMAAGAMMRQAAPAPLTAAASGIEGALDSRFTFEATVDLESGQMLSMPFLAESLESERLLLWRGALGTRAGSPDAILRIENDLPVRLPPGIMTVSDAEGGYVGDAAVPLVAPGETREVSYGEDRGIRVAEETEAERRRLTVRVAEGALRIRSEDRRTARYAVTVQSGEAETVTVDHPVEPGWSSSVVAPQAAEGEPLTDADGAKWLRTALSVPVSNDGPGEVELVIRDVHPVEEALVLGSLDTEGLLYWSGEADTEEDRAFLAEAGRLAAALDAALGEASAADEEVWRLSAEQERVRQNLAAVGEGSTAAERYLASLLDLEDRIADANARAEAARAEAERLGDALESHLASA